MYLPDLTSKEKKGKTFQCRSTLRWQQRKLHKLDVDSMHTKTSMALFQCRKMSCKNVEIIITCALTNIIDFFIGSLPYSTGICVR